MDWEYVGVAALAALIASVVAHVLFRAWLDRALERRLEAFAAREPGRGRGEGATPEDLRGAGVGHFAEIAPELVSLARSATDSAIRKEEVHAWHGPNVSAIGSDDISDVIHENLRRASLNALVARSLLSEAIRKHRSSIPTELEAELRAFCDRLSSDEAGTAAERKRRLAGELDALEAGFRDVLGANLTATASEGPGTAVQAS